MDDFPSKVTLTVFLRVPAVTAVVHYPLPLGNSLLTVCQSLFPLCEGVFIYCFAFYSLEQARVKTGKMRGKILD